MYGTIGRVTRSRDYLRLRRLGRLEPNWVLYSSGWCGEGIKTSYWYNEKEQAKRERSKKNKERGMWKLFALGSSQRSQSSDRI